MTKSKLMMQIFLNFHLRVKYMQLDVAYLCGVRLWTARDPAGKGSECEERRICVQVYVNWRKPKTFSVFR